ncbi:hypothetical protein [Anoxybacteroides rupiense]|uniref:hypothetical protein n=1 Tax=Anoxybacteroides rupiense TaxID=311460 RepID=UPI0036726DC5
MTNQDAVKELLALGKEITNEIKKISISDDFDAGYKEGLSTANDMIYARLEKLLGEGRLEKEAVETTTDHSENKATFYIVTLKHGHLNYYLVDSKLTLSLDKSSSMLFVDKELATDYASKLEYAYAKFMNSEALGYVECHEYLYSIQ